MPDTDGFSEGWLLGWDEGIEEGIPEADGFIEGWLLGALLIEGDSEG